VWVNAQQQGFAVQPVSPPFLYARNRAELNEVSHRYAEELASLQRDFIALTRVAEQESIALILRLTTAAPAAVHSRRSESRIRT